MSSVHYQDVDKCVDGIIKRVGKKIVLGIPMGLGKPNHLTNALYRRARQDPEMHLKILTALTLEKPKGKSDLEKRFMEPFVERVFGDYPDLDYAQDMRRNQLPDNVEVVQFFFKPGDCMGNSTQQQNYISANYTDAARAFMSHHANVLAQMIAKDEKDGKVRYSLSCNPDVSLQLAPMMRERQRQGKGEVLIVGQVNRQLPFMHRDAIVEESMFDMVIDDSRYDHTLFSTPNMPVTMLDYMIGLYASTLIRDGGTLQIGIGSLGDAIVYGCQLRHKHNQAYRRVLEKFSVMDHFGSLIEETGGIDPFVHGLYGSSEMFVNGFWHLYKDGILRRRVYDSIPLQKLMNEGKLSERVTPNTLNVLLDEGVIDNPLTKKDVDFLQHFGFLKDSLNYVDGQLQTMDGTAIPADPVANKNDFIRYCLGDHVKRGTIMHGGFYLGPRSLYQELHDLGEEAHQSFCMTGVSHVNQLYGDEKLRALQRRDARFINTCLMMTLNGAAVSDGLDDGRVVSGVGGQYNFVAMAHALPDARSILMLRSNRAKGAGVSSNIVWNYGHITIPRHLRDIVITEYGIADLRDKSDKDVVAALLNVTDSRFQEKLLEKARLSGKISMDYQIPECYRHNTPERLSGIFKTFQKEGLFPVFPFGCDFTDEEIILGKALKNLKAKMDSPKGMLKGGVFKSFLQAVEKTVLPKGARPYLARLGLDKPANMKEHLLQRLIVAELQNAGVIGEAKK